MVPQADLLKLVSLLDSLSADLKAGRIRSVLIVAAGDGLDHTAILAPLDTAALMLFTLEVGLMDAIRDKRTTQGDKHEDMMLGGNFKL